VRCALPGRSRRSRRRLTAVTSQGPEPTLHAVVLAAGASTRFGSPKQLVRIEGRPLLHTIVSRAVEIAGHSVTVVLGAHAEELSALLRHCPASVIVNREWSEGIGSSIRAGVARLPGSCDGVMILLGDQPGVSTDDLRRLAGAWRRQPELVAAAQYGSTTGVPAIFPRTMFADLASLRGDRGAQRLVHRNPDRLVRVRMPSAGLDVDTPEDLLGLSER
jgi:molybdenum cofactor cytidylyltransferase